MPRLGVQHYAWRATVLESWRRAGLKPGDRVVDMGAGPGWASWRASGGEPDVAPSLVAALRAGGFWLRSVRPLVFATKPGELTWQWPARFVATDVARLQELGRVSQAWGNAMLKELAEAEADADSVMITPMVPEIIAKRE